MRKLKLESVKVESFSTTPAVTRQRGTLHAHQQHVSLETYDIQECGDTRYFDCTFGCSVATNCAGGCVETVYECA
jgi:hypothetical protein